MNLMFPYRCPIGCGHLTAYPDVVCCARCLVQPPLDGPRHTAECLRWQTPDSPPLEVTPVVLSADLEQRLVAMALDRGIAMDQLCYDVLTEAVARHEAGRHNDVFYKRLLRMARGADEEEGSRDG